MNMELIERLETRFDELMLRVRQLEEDNRRSWLKLRKRPGRDGKCRTGLKPFW